MEGYPKLSKAPIREALIDLRVKLPSDCDVKRIDSLYEKVNEKYPEKREQRQSQLHFELKPSSELVQSVPLKITGYHYVSKNKDEIFQARLDGFTYNRLSPIQVGKNFEMRQIDYGYCTRKQYSQKPSPGLPCDT